MSQIMTRGRVCILFCILVLAITGCGTPNDQNPFDPDTGQHKNTVDWLPSAHADAASVNIGSCQGCHGEDLLGGIVGEGCTTCHIGGPTSAHPASWTTVTAHGPYVSSNGASSCRNGLCHGVNLEGVTGPACKSCH